MAKSADTYPHSWRRYGHQEMICTCGFVIGTGFNETPTDDEIHEQLVENGWSRDCSREWHVKGKIKAVKKRKKNV